MFSFRECTGIFRCVAKGHGSNPLTNYIDVRTIKRYVAPTMFELKRRRERAGPEATRQAPRSKYLDWNHRAEVFAFGKRLNESFDQNLLMRALTHQSYLSQQRHDQTAQSHDGNRSFVTEGEEFMTNYVREYLKESYPLLPTEGVSSVCESLMSTGRLSHVAHHIGIRDITLTAEHPVSDETLAATLKSVVAALLYSSGENRASLFVRDVLITQLNCLDIGNLWEMKEPLVMLAKVLRSMGRPDGEFEFRLCAQAGKNTLLAAYQVGLYQQKQMIGKGWGESVDVAKEMAARHALRQIFKTDSAKFALQLNRQPMTSSHDSWTNNH